MGLCIPSPAQNPSSTEGEEYCTPNASVHVNRAPDVVDRCLHLPAQTTIYEEAEGGARFGALPKSLFGSAPIFNVNLAPAKDLDG